MLIQNFHKPTLGLHTRSIVWKLSHLSTIFSPFIRFMPRSLITLCRVTQRDEKKMRQHSFFYFCIFKEHFCNFCILIYVLVMNGSPGTKTTGANKSLKTDVNGANQSRFAVRKVQTKKLFLGDFRNIGHLKVLNDTKLVLNGA